MTESKTRIRWTKDEKQLLAAEMVRLLDEDPRQSKLQAVMKAQQALPAPRRRAVAAWATVREQLEPCMKEALAAAAAAKNVEAPATVPDANEASGVESGVDTVDADAPADMPAQAARFEATAALSEPGTRASIDGAPDNRLGGLFAQQIELVTQLGAKALERMLLQALSSPAVAERLAALVRDAMAAPAGVPAPGTTAPESVGRPAAPLAMPRPKVLVAGLEPAQANDLAEAFSDSLDLRNWRPGETKEQLRSLARVCTVAVLLAEALDHDTEATLKAMHLRIVKHSGGFARLKDRLRELVDSGMFNVLT